MSRIIDVHCTHCQQVIIPANQVRPLSQFENGRKTPSANELYVICIQSAVLLNADFICPNCSRMIYWRLNEQKLNMVLAQK